MRMGQGPCMCDVNSGNLSSFARRRVVSWRWTSRIIRSRKEFAVARVRKAFDHPDLPRQRCRRGHRARAASGFTMLEILTVIGILAVLAAMVLLGMRHVTGKSKEQETRLTLQNLRNMLAEYENVTKLGKEPEQWPWNNGSRRTVL